MSEQRPDRPNPKRNRTGLGNGGMRFGRGLMGWLLFVAVAALLFVWLKQASPGSATIPISTFWQQSQAHNIEKLTIDDTEVNGKFKNAININGQPHVDKFKVNIPQGMATWEFVQAMLNQMGTTTEISAEPTNNFLVNVVFPIIPWLLILAFIWFFVFRQLRNSAGAGGMLGNFGRSRAKLTSKENTNITFDDVAGVEEAKEEV